MARKKKQQQEVDLNSVVLVKDRLVRCPICPLWFDNAASLCGHLYSAHTKPGSAEWAFTEEEKKVEEEKMEIWECKFCGEVFRSEEEILKHLEEKHYEEIQKLIEEEEKSKEKGKQ